MRRFMTNTYTLEKKALSAKAIKKIKLSDQDKTDIGEHSWKKHGGFALWISNNFLLKFESFQRLKKVFE